MKKFIYKNDKNIEKYFEYCVWNDIPFILISEFDKDFNEIFYDITNLKNYIDYDLISIKMKKFFEIYSEIFLISEDIVEIYKNDKYFFRFILFKEDSERFAEKVFDYINYLYKK